MELSTETLDGGVTRVLLSGRMDILGVQAVDMKFTALTASQGGRVVVDLSGVSFLASLGMRTLISSAKALAARGGRMVLLNPQPKVLEVLQVSGLASLIPVHAELDAALADVRG